MNTESQVLNVPIEDIIPNRFQPRLNFEDDGLKDLAQSIKEHGIIQPLVLRRLGDKYEIIAGERRYKAAKMAGLASVPAIIAQLNDKESAEVAIVENIQRRDLTAIEEAKSYKALLDKGYLTQEELARRMGVSQSAISNKLRLLNLAEAVQTALMDGKISERHARSLLKIEDKEEQVKWLNKIISDRLTVQALDKELKEITPKEEKAVQTTVVMEDIVPNRENTPVVDISSNNLDKPMPNKFFNFLEDESVNMNLSEPVINEQESNEQSSPESITPIEENNVINDATSQEDEEIELLDFELPLTETVETNESNIIIADELVNKLVENLNDNKFNASLNKDEKENKIQYTITIDKN